MREDYLIIAPFFIYFLIVPTLYLISMLYILYQYTQPIIPKSLSFNKNILNTSRYYFLNDIKID